MSRLSLPARSLAWPIPWPAVSLIANAEGLRLTAYKCPAGIWTLGWGETDNVRAGMRWTKAQADAVFCASLTEYTEQVLAMCKRTPTPEQLGALVSLAYNIGPGAPRARGGLYRSTVLKQFNAGNDEASARAFSLYNQATVGGRRQVLPGLAARRSAEAALYLSPSPGAPPAAMPQAVAAESPLIASPIAQGGAATAGAGVLTLLSSVADNADTLNTSAATITSIASKATEHAAAFAGLPLPQLLALVLIAAGAAVLVHRYRQRAEGWA